MKDRHSSGGLPVEEIADTGQSTCTDDDCLYTSSVAYNVYMFKIMAGAICSIMHVRLFSAFFNMHSLYCSSCSAMLFLCRGI